MARVNITIPDELLKQARTAGLNVSRLSAAALAEELDRQARIVELETYLRELDTDMGPVTADEQAAAREWANEALGNTASSPDPRSSRTA